MKVVLQCWSSHDDTCGCDYAIVELTPTLARLILDRIERVRRLEREDPGVTDARWWDPYAVYFSPWDNPPGPDDPEPDAEETERMERSLADLDNGSEVVEAPDEFAVGKRMQARTECDRMVVSDDGVSFSCIAKHTDVRISTATIPEEVLRRAAGNADAGERTQTSPP